MTPLKQTASRYREWPWLYYYSIGKIGLDPAYPVVAEILRDSRHPLLDIGCGMGLLAAYLRAQGHTAPISGMDIDEEKIQLANALLAAEQARFHAGDALDHPAHQGDVVMLDVLHYFDDEGQDALLQKIADSLPAGGVALIRVGLSQPNWRYALTRIEEWFVKAVKWIPTSGWNFPTREEVLAPFDAERFSSEVRPMWGYTPFNSYLFTFRRKG